MWVCFHLHIIGLKFCKICQAKKRPRLIQVAVQHLASRESTSWVLGILTSATE
jgi:hypothetical protein